jgi:hypothetical protein
VATSTTTGRATSRSARSPPSAAFNSSGRLTGRSAADATARSSSPPAISNVQSFTRNYIGLAPSYVTGDFAGDGRLQALGSNGDVWRMTCP